MIYSMLGIIQSAEDQVVLLQVGPICWSISVMQAEHYKVGNETLFYIYWHWNSEQGPSLFGFNHILDRSVFSLIMSSSGLGPKIGLAALSQLGSATFLKAIETCDISLLNSISGVGTRKAEQMVLQLKHKIGQLHIPPELSGNYIAAHIPQVHKALESLHYSRQEIHAALQHLQNQQSAGTELSFEQLIRQALNFLSKQP